MSGPVALERFGTPTADEISEDATAAAPLEPAPEDSADADPEPDPEAIRLACLARIAGALEIAASEQAGLRSRCIGDAAAALGAAAETLLPRLARAGFAALVAETAQTIARRGRWPELVLSVAPGDAEAIATALDGIGPGIGPGTEVHLAEDPALDSGEAQLSWAGGGAEIDAEAIAESALERFRGQLDACMHQGA